VPSTAVGGARAKEIFWHSKSGEHTMIYADQPQMQSTFKLEDDQMSYSTELATTARCAENEDPYKIFEENGGGSPISGPFLRHKKGSWFINGDEIDLADETFIAHMPTLTDTWECWDDGKVADRRIYRLGERIEPRDALGRTDPSEWPKSKIGKPDDPWVHNRYLGVERISNRELLMFATAAAGGKRELSRLARDFRSGRYRHPGCMPVLRLSSRPYDHPEYGKTFNPVLQIVDRAPYELDEHQPAIVAPSSVADASDAEDEREIPPLEAYEAARF
jgi:hypothetical protein